MYIDFLAPTLTRTLNKKDVIVVQNFSGQNAGGPTNCFTGEPPIFLANLFRAGKKQPQSIEFIPLKRGTAKTGLEVTNFVSLGTCLLGEDFTQKFRGQIVGQPCNCRRCSKSTKASKKKSKPWLSPVSKK